MKKALSLLAALSLLLPISCSKSPEPPKAEAPALEASAPSVEEVRTPEPLGDPQEKSEPAPAPASAQAPLPDLSGGTEKEILQYVLDDLKGSVQIIPKGSTNPETAQEEESVEEGDTVVTGAGSEATLTLNENTLFKMSENSKVVIGKLVSSGTQGFLSRLKLLGGKVLSEVEKLGESRSTFEVEAGGVVCGVRGTAFEVAHTGSEVQTNTFHGLVEVKDGKTVQPVGVDETLSFSKARRSFQAKRRIQAAERNRYLSWRQAQTLVRQRAARRTEIFRAAAQLPPSDRARIFREAGQGGRRNRVKQMRLRYMKMREEGRLPRHENFRRNDRKPLPGKREQGLDRKKQDRTQMRERIQDRRNDPKEKEGKPGLDASRRLSNRTLGEKAEDRKEDSPTGPGPQGLEKARERLKDRKEKRDQRETVRTSLRDRSKDRKDQLQERRRNPKPQAAQGENSQEVKKDPPKRGLDLTKTLHGAAAKEKLDKKGPKRLGKQDDPKKKPDPKKKKPRKPGDKKDDPDHDPPIPIKKPNNLFKP